MSYGDRRRFLKGAGAATVAGLAGCIGGDGGSGGGGDLTTVETMVPSGTVYYPFFQSSIDAGIWEEHGIDLQMDYKPFPAYATALANGEMDVGVPPFVPNIANVLKGENFKIFSMAGSFLGINGLFVRADSDFHSIQDLEGARIGVWSWGSSTVQSFQALIAEQAGLDLQKDFETTTAAPPALKGLLDKGDIDAVIEVSTFSIALTARPDEYRRLAQLNNMWLEQTGHPLVITNWFCTNEWYENHTDLASTLAAATVDTAAHWRENIPEIFGEYGERAGITDQNEIDVVEKWADRGLTWAGDVDGNQDFVDAQWQYLELMNEHGFLDGVPSQDEVLRSPLV